MTLWTIARQGRSTVLMVGTALLRLPWSDSGKESTCQCRRHRRHGFNPWVRKIPWRRKWLPTPVFLPGESLWTRGPWWATVHGVTESWTQLSTHSCRELQVLQISAQLSLFWGDPQGSSCLSNPSLYIQVDSQS